MTFTSTLITLLLHYSTLERLSSYPQYLLFRFLHVEVNIKLSTGVAPEWSLMHSEQENVQPVNCWGLLWILNLSIVSIRKMPQVAVDWSAVLHLNLDVKLTLFKKFFSNYNPPDVDVLCKFNLILNVPKFSEDSFIFNRLPQIFMSCEWQVEAIYFVIF